MTFCNIQGGGLYDLRGTMYVKNAQIEMDGNVYRRNDNGSWDRRDSGGWSKTDAPSAVDRSRPSTGTRRTRW